MKHFKWFYLEPYVHISIKYDRVLLYNTLNGISLSFDANEELLDLVKRIDSLENLRIIQIREGSLLENNVRSFILRARKLFMGDLLDCEWSTGKPVEIPPLPRVHLNLERSQETDLWKREDISSYVTEISFFVCNRKSNDIKILENAYKQFLVSCGTDMVSSELKIGAIKETLDELSLSAINILGGNIFEYSELDCLLAHLSKLSLQRRVFVIYSDFLGNKDKLKRLADTGIELRIIVPPTFRIETMEYISNQINELSLEGWFIFIVTSEREVDLAEAVISELGISKSLLQPYFDGSNLAFFRERVFMTNEDILTSKPTMREIIQRTQLNPSAFGKLSVLPTGYVFSNVNKPALGKIGINSVREMIITEMQRKHGWFNTRHEFVPCKDCLYEYLCPPPSNYEYAIGRHNLCSVM